MNVLPVPKGDSQFEQVDPTHPGCAYVVGTSS